jgi:hypothetical protein
LTTNKARRAAISTAALLFFTENTKNIAIFKEFSKKDELIFADSESYIIFAREIKII